jgi:hypothetical protein
MYKLVLIFIVALLSYNNSDAMAKEKPLEKEEICQWEYWNAFSKTFNKTSDFWASESAALEAEETAEQRTGVEEWLDEYAPKEENTCSGTKKNI